MNILFVSHAASRGGAAGVLLELLRFVRLETAHQSTILMARRGALEGEFARYARAFPRAEPFQNATRLAGAARRLGESDFPRRALALRVLGRAALLNARRARGVSRALPRFDLVYANSAASGEAVRALEPVLRGGAKLAVHVHELGWALSQNQPGWEFLRARGDLFFAASGAVRRELIENQGVAPEKIEVVYEWLDFAALETDKDAARLALRRQIGAPEGGGVGRRLRHFGASQGRRLVGAKRLSCSVRRAERAQIARAAPFRVAGRRG